jgi:hypothetical protein
VCQTPNQKVVIWSFGQSKWPSRARRSGRFRPTPPNDDPHVTCPGTTPPDPTNQRLATTNQEVSLYFGRADESYRVRTRHAHPLSAPYQEPHVVRTPRGHHRPWNANLWAWRTEANQNAKNHRGLVCRICGGVPVVRPPGSDERLRKAFCRNCLNTRIQRMTNDCREWSGLPDGGASKPLDPTDEYEDDIALWNRVRSASAIYSVLLHIKDSVDSGQEEISHQWDGGPADQPLTWFAEGVDMARALLERNGYREVSVVTGIARELAAQGQLGNFYALYDEHDDQPHWTARVVFRKVAGGSDPERRSSPRLDPPVGD